MITIRRSVLNQVRQAIQNTGSRDIFTITSELERMAEIEAKRSALYKKYVGTDSEKSLIFNILQKKGIYKVSDVKRALDYLEYSEAV
jgi:hypothetical protein